jgi:hypothetical protein
MSEVVAPTARLDSGARPTGYDYQTSVEAQRVHCRWGVGVGDDPPRASLWASSGRAVGAGLNHI